MKTKELIKRVKELGYEIKRSGYNIEIMFNDCIVAEVYTDQMYVITFYHHEKLLLTNIDKLFDLLIEYAKTPIDKREEEKKFYLKHRWLKSGGLYMYVKHHTKPYGEEYELVSCTYGEINDMQYTIKEIEEIEEKFDTDLKDFELVEVEE